jgi:hypothetical protein
MKTNLVTKTMKSLRRAGLIPTLLKIGRYLCTPYVEHKMQRRIFSHQSIEDRFTEIYKLNAWGSRESVSGNGSTLALTESVRTSLPILLARFQLHAVFDAPCGDFNWMKHVVREYPIDYTGADIVSPLIGSLNARFGNQYLRFFHFDLTNAKFPKADLMICRDCLLHLSYRDTELVLRNYVEAGIPYLLTSTHTNRTEFANRDIPTGGFRLIDLFADPYHFPSEVLFRFEDVQVEQKETEMCLWSRDQIVEVLKNFGTPSASVGATSEKALVVKTILG